jgi:hypothetical protein
MSRMAPYGVGEEHERRSTALGMPSRGLGTARSGAPAPYAQYALRSVIGAAVVVQTLLLLISLVPATTWSSLGESPDGPLPHSLSWLIAGVFYVLPALTGALCRRWQLAVVLATLPAWLDLGVYAVATASRLGPFNLAQDIHAPGTVGTLELFAVLGGLGWLARAAVLLVLSDRAQSRGMGR